MLVVLLLVTTYDWDTDGRRSLIDILQTNPDRNPLSLYHLFDIEAIFLKYSPSVIAYCVLH